MPYALTYLADRVHKHHDRKACRELVHRLMDGEEAPENTGPPASFTQLVERSHLVGRLGGGVFDLLNDSYTDELVLRRGVPDYPQAA